jgi:hypothetical protein
LQTPVHEAFESPLFDLYAEMSGKPRGQDTDLLRVIIADMDDMKRQPVDWLSCYTYNALVPHSKLMKSTEAPRCYRSSSESPSQNARFRFPLLARLRQAVEHQECPLIGIDRKGPADGQSDAIDPQPSFGPWADLADPKCQKAARL